MPTHKRDFSRVSLTDLGDLTGKPYRTVVKRLEGLEPAAQDGKTLWYVAREALERIYGHVSPMAERIRLDASRADAQEMKNQVTRGELVPGVDVALVGATFLNAVKMRVMGLRTLGPLIRAAGSDAEAAEILDSGARDALSELAGMGDLAREVARSQRSDGGAGGDAGEGVDATPEADDERVG